MALLIPANNHQPITEVKPTNGRDFHLPQLYTLLSCSTIEIYPLADGRRMIIDEEGKLTKKPRNERATALADFATPSQIIATFQALRELGINIISTDGQHIEADFIAGDALICTPEEID